jgi:hypothetical protein
MLNARQQSPANVVVGSSVDTVFEQYRPVLANRLAFFIDCGRRVIERRDVGAFSVGIDPRSKCLADSTEVVTARIVRALLELLRR